LTVAKRDITRDSAALPQRGHRGASAADWVRIRRLTRR
jgi:hypothetical protein